MPPIVVKVEETRDLMPIVVIMQLPTMSEDHRDELLLRANLFDDPPRGLLLHACSPLRVNEQLFVEAWESTDDHQRYLYERLIPAARSLTDELGRVDAPVEPLTTICVVQPRIATTLPQCREDVVRRFAAL